MTGLFRKLPPGQLLFKAEVIVFADAVGFRYRRVPVGEMKEFHDFEAALFDVEVDLSFFKIRRDGPRRGLRIPGLSGLPGGQAPVVAGLAQIAAPGSSARLPGLPSLRRRPPPSGPA